MNVLRDNYSNAMSIATPLETTPSPMQQTTTSTSAVIPSSTIASTHTNSNMTTTNTANSNNTTSNSNASNCSINSISNGSIYNINSINSINSSNDDKNGRGRNRGRNNTIYMNVDVSHGMCQGIHIMNGKAYKCRNKSVFFVNNSVNLCHKHKEQKIDY